MRCRERVCLSNQGKERTFVKGSYTLPMGAWCDDCWTHIDGRSQELVSTLDEMRDQPGAFRLVEQMIERDPN